MDAEGKGMSANADEPLLVTVKQAQALIGIGNTKFYDLALAGRFEMVQLEGRTMVIFKSLKAYVDSLPRWQSKRDQEARKELPPLGSV